MAPNVALLGQGTHGAMVLGSVQHVARMRMQMGTARDDRRQRQKTRSPLQTATMMKNKALGMWEVAFQLAEADPRRIAPATEPLPVFHATCDVTDLKHALSSLFPLIPAKLLHNTAILWNLIGKDETSLPVVVNLQGVGWQGYYISRNAPTWHEVHPSGGSHACIFVHGAGWRQAAAILREGVVRPSQWTAGKIFHQRPFLPGQLGSSGGP